MNGEKENQSLLNLMPQATFSKLIWAILSFERNSLDLLISDEKKIVRNIIIILYND